MEKKDPPLGGVVAGSRERKWGLAVKGKGGQSSSQSSSSFLSHLQMRSSNLPPPPPPPPPKAILTNTSSLVQSFFFPFLFLTWVASLYFCVVPSNRDMSSERKGRKNGKNKKKSPPSSKRTKRNLQLSEESVGGRGEKNVRLAQVAIFHVLIRRRRA